MYNVVEWSKNNFNLHWTHFGKIFRKPVVDTVK